MPNKNALKNIYESRSARVVLLTGLGLAALSGCANMEGDGNDFTVRGKVESVGKHHTFRLEDMTIESAKGDSAEYFREHEEDKEKFSFSDNYRDCKFSGLEKIQVGQAFNSQGDPESYSDIQPGDVVEVTGKLRDSFTKCGKHSRFEERPVYDQVREIAQ